VTREEDGVTREEDGVTRGEKEGRKKGRRGDKGGGRESGATGREEEREWGDKREGRAFSKQNKRVRYRGIAKNQFSAFMQAIIFNFKRLAVLSQQYQEGRQPISA
jgi:IS5 family transposase